jgi:hypothetical protein
MLGEALAVAGGSVVMREMGTDAWTRARVGLAELLAIGAPNRELVELERLDGAAVALKRVGPSGQAL